MSQNFVKDSSMTVEKYLESKGAKMINFSRIEVGEGIEKKEDDFAGKFTLMLSRMPGLLSLARRRSMIRILNFLS